MVRARRRPYGVVVSLQAFIRARDRIAAATEQRLALDDVLAELVSALHDVAGFEWCAVALTDPETMLPFGGAVEGMDPSMCVPFWDNELLDPDFVKFNALSRSSDPIGTLFDATDGDLERSPRFVKLLAGLGAGDELRVAFAAGGSCWAVASLVRAAARGPFALAEIDAVRGLVPVTTRAIGDAVTRRDSGQAPIGPVMLVVDEAGAIESMTPEAEALLHDLRIDGLDELATPTAVLAAARRALNHRSATTTALRARCRSGRWLKVHASPLSAGGRVAVMIEPARQSDLVPILLESYGLTARETEIVLLIARGFATKEIAAQLCISTHTVHDHVKVIFTKCGVSSRGELVASLFSHHLWLSHHTAVAHLDPVEDIPA